MWKSPSKLFRFIYLDHTEREPWTNDELLQFTVTTSNVNNKIQATFMIIMKVINSIYINQHN